MLTIRKVISQAVSQLTAHQQENLPELGNPLLDAELLLAEVLGCDRDYLLINSREEVGGDKLIFFTKLLNRRLKDEPVAYILGRKEFWGLGFKVNSDVLIPRPDTEILVEQALAFLSNRNRQRLKILELGTGSGCIAISLAFELEKMQADYSITAADKSFPALKVAKDNRERLTPNAKINFLQSDWFESIPQQEFDLIVSNPPYVNQQQNLQRDLSYEPESALYSNNQGLADLEAIISSARSYMLEDACLMLEFGSEQIVSLEQISANYGFDTHVINDLASRPRVIILS